MASFSTTFLGHQGWLFQTGRSCLLVDPLLCEEFGHAHALTYRVFPPRILVPEAFPRVDALFLTHEHDDHFDVPSLARIDRRIPVYLSARSSTAGFAILREMGFSVQPFVPGQPYRFRDLEIVALCGDQVNTNTGDEWDTLPFLVRQTEGAGSFFSTVDVKLVPGHLEAVKALVTKPGLWAWTNNAQDWSHVATFLRERTDGTESATLRMRSGHAMINAHWGPLAAMITCAGGFSFYGERAWLNQRVFCVDMDRVCKTLGMLFPQQRFFAGRPGQTFHMSYNRLKSVDPKAPFLSTAPQETWPSRVPVPMKEFPDYRPATSRTDLTEGDLPLLRERLTAFAGSLVGGTLFKSLYSLVGAEATGRVPTFALVLRSGEDRQALVFAYNPNGCTFDPVQSDNPQGAYLAGMECWATDLLAALGGEIGPIALAFGRSSLWNALPERFNFDMLGELFRMSHPLRRPAEYLRIYQHQLKQCAEGAPEIMHRPAEG